MFSNTAQKVSSIFAAVGLVLGLDSCASTPIHVEKRTAPTPTGSEFQSLAFTFPKVGTYHVEVDVARWVGIDEAVGYTALDTNLVVSSPGTTFLLDADIISEINRGVGHSIRVAEVRSTDKAQLLFADDSY